jgi:hypothetical protein
MRTFGTSKASKLRTSLAEPSCSGRAALRDERTHSIRQRLEMRLDAVAERGILACTQKKKGEKKEKA